MPYPPKPSPTLHGFLPSMAQSVVDHRRVNISCAFWFLISLEYWKYAAQFETYFVEIVSVCPLTLKNCRSIGNVQMKMKKGDKQQTNWAPPLRRSPSKEDLNARSEVELTFIVPLNFFWVIPRIRQVRKLDIFYAEVNNFGTSCFRKNNGTLLYS